MDITVDEMKKSIKRMYERLDEVSPVDFDCGKLCGEVCCVYDVDETHTEELVLYLLPGEELMYEDSDEFELYYMDSSEIKYPPSWKDNIFLVKLTINKKTYKVSTNSKGVAIFFIKLTKKGKYIAVYKHDGNSNFKSTTKKVRITIY